MRPVHKAMMAMLKKMLLKKPESERSMEEKGLLAAYVAILLYRVSMLPPRALWQIYYV